MRLEPLIRMAKELINKSTLERIYPGDISEQDVAGYNTLLLHEQRYHYAGQHAVTGNIIDAACGSGYGSYLLATLYNSAGGNVIGLDKDIDAINYAKNKYRHLGIEFIQTDIFSFVPLIVFDTIISLETIEHLLEPQNFINRFSLFLKEGGRFIASAPVTPSMDANPYHLHDFTISSFKQLFVNAGLKEIDSFVQVQPFNPLKLFHKRTDRIAGMRKNLAGYYLRNPKKFFLRLKSVFRSGFKNKYLLVVFEKI